MMNIKLFITFWFTGFCFINAQLQGINDSLKDIIKRQKGDTTEVNAFFNLSILNYEQNLIDSGNKYARQGLALAQNIKYKKGEADCYLFIAAVYGDQENHIQAIENYFNALRIYTDIGDFQGEVTVHIFLHGSYQATGDTNNSMTHLLAGLKIAETNHVRGFRITGGDQITQFYFAEIGQIYLLRNQLDSALFYTQKAIDQKYLVNGSVWDFPIYLMGNIQRQKRNYDLALAIYRSAIPLAIQNRNFHDTLQIFSGMSTLFKMQGKLDSAIYYAQIVVQSVNPSRQTGNYFEAVNNLAQVYKLKGDKDNALKYIEIYHAVKDSIYDIKKNKEIQNIAFNEQMKQQEIISAQDKNKGRMQLYTVIGGLFAMLVIAGILWNNNRLRQKAYALLQNQKQETDAQKKRVEEALDKLKNTQSQLIQSEKMASLGELTTGIAHEIQNPLNFVNNFSEINVELTTDLRDELSRIEMEPSDKMNLGQMIDDLLQNEGKINLHGKRAGAIVKSMLQHSRKSSGQKEPTDINALADEYLKMSYQGLRAKDKSLNVTLKADYDQSVGKINVIPQDIGRVLLNICNNAFYAVNTKMKSADENYRPTVSVTTKRSGITVEIQVTDNGTGIPQKLQEKIFQPFFTTKPTGEGTGLGLSLSYDIIKAHGGEIRVESTEGEGTTIFVALPV
jgi:two-component system NtrC family sensor kinase